MGSFQVKRRHYSKFLLGGERAYIVVVIAVYAWCVCRGEGNGSVCLRGEERGEGRAGMRFRLTQPLPLSLPPFTG